jgi:hypothetical protein
MKVMQEWKEGKVTTKFCAPPIHIEAHNPQPPNLCWSTEESPKISFVPSLSHKALKLQ